MMTQVSKSPKKRIHPHEEKELLFQNTLEEFAPVSNNRLFMVTLKEMVVKFEKAVMLFSQKAGIPLEVKVHFKITFKNKGIKP
jgi:hypothetical protein